MHQNFYFLRRLSAALDERLRGLTLCACFSQNKDELLLGFCGPEDERWVKASLQPGVNALSFPETFARAGKNSVDLFKGALDRRVSGVRQYENERCFGVQFEGGAELLFKLFGNRSNVIFFDEQGEAELFHSKFGRDAELDRSALDRPIEQSYEAYAERGLKAVFPTFGKEVKRELARRGLEEGKPSESWPIIERMLEELEGARTYVRQEGDTVELLGFDPGGADFSSEDPVEAANEYFYRFSKHYFLGRERQAALKELERKYANGLSYLEKTERKLEELQSGSRYEELANILMANLHQLPERSKKVELFDFYREQTIEIKLKETLSPQKNAENLYRKAKNQKIEIAALRKNLAAKEAEIERLDAHISAIRGVESVKELRKYLKEQGLSQEKRQREALPFRRFNYQGYDIWVGRNAKNNDLLTQKHAYKEDLWLHAKDVAGSHVVVKHQAGKPYPAPVVEKAAALAAYYSQRKGDTLCPVLFTPKKFVRKPKGMPPGAVVVDKEEVVMVEPMAFGEG